MARNENPPFGRGETFYGISPSPAIDTNNLGGQEFEGKTWLFEDLDFSKTNKPARTNRYVLCMCVRNDSGAALLPQRLVTFEKTAGKFPGKVDGYATVDADHAYPVDEFLPSTGVPANDLFWIVIEGPAMCLTPLDGGADNVFSVGTVVTSLTAASSGATSAGRVKPQVTTGATTAFALEVMNYIGRALSAATTANTGANLLVDVGKW